MRLIVEFAYNNNIPLSEETIQELLHSAGFFNIMSISVKCCTFLGNMLCANNCIGIYQLTKYNFCIELEHKAYKFILSNFCLIESSEEFLQLDMEHFCSIIASDHLSVSSEAIVFRAIVRWINHAVEDRKEFIAILFSKVKSILLFLLLWIITQQCNISDL